MARLKADFGKGEGYPDLNLYMAGLSIDNVIFGFHDNQLKVLLLECLNRKDWMLPGGYIHKEEAVDDAAKRVLKDRTGLKSVYLQQFHVFGDPSRSKETIIKGVMNSMQLNYNENEWFLQRFITIGYYALVEFDKVVPVPDPLSVSCAWHDIGELPPLIFDHQDIILQALTAMRHHLNYQPIGYNLLSKEFTMKNLQSIYETILNRKLERSNFNRKMLASGILDKKEKLFSGGAHKAPYLYSFNKKQYFKVLKEGLNNEF
jgi:8-oxo-dGTP diphosphatase